VPLLVSLFYLVLNTWLLLAAAVVELVVVAFMEAAVELVVSVLML
jgi:hypothetical protein